MARLKTPSTQPPGGYTYRQNETQLVMNSDSLHGLIAKVVQHRQYRSLTPDDTETVALEVERQICARLGENECYAEPKDDWVPVKQSSVIKLSSVASLSRAALEWVRTGRELVSIEESKRRSEICKLCVLNRPIVGCKCSVLFKMIAAAVPKERRDEALGICGACGCELKSKVNLPAHVVAASNAGNATEWPVFCWQRKENISS